MPDNAIELLLEFEDQVRRDNEHAPAFLHRRDRLFALACKEEGVVPVPQRWLEHLNRLNGQQSGKSSKRLLRLWRRVMVGFAFGGGLLGIFAMLGLLFYEGGQRINITVILGVVLLELLLALITSAEAVIGWQPWHWLLRRMGIEQRDTALRELQPQLMARAAHVGGLWFGLTGLLTLLFLVVVQDLAFGWSTTLQTGALGYHNLIQTLAWPWHSLWPAAVPDLSLVEQTRFFRAGDMAIHLNPSRWGEWWPFVTMLWLFYVILPRVGLLLFSWVHLHIRARTLLAGHPALTALYYRMETPALDTGNAHHDAADQPDIRTEGALQPLLPSRILIRWAGAGDTQLPESLLRDQPQSLAAGGRATLGEDNETIEIVRHRLAGESAPVVWLATRGWESPTGELADFIEQAGGGWPTGTRIVLLPLATEPAKKLSTHQLAQWLRFVERSGNKCLQVSLPDVEEDQGDE